jgi:hypothetical protein
MNQAGTGPTPSSEDIDPGQERLRAAMRAVALVGGPVEVRGALDLETTQAGVMPRRLPAWTKEQYQDPSVYGVTVMPSGVRLVFRTDARALELEVLTSTGQLDADPHPRPTGMLELVVDGALAGRRQAPVGNVLRMASPAAVQRLIPGEPGTVRFAGLPAGMKNVELWLPQQTPTELVALRADVGSEQPERMSHARTRPSWRRCPNWPVKATQSSLCGTAGLRAAPCRARPR